MPDPNILRTEEAVKPHVGDSGLEVESDHPRIEVEKRLPDNLPFLVVGQVVSRIGLSCEPPLAGLWYTFPGAGLARSAFVIPRLSVIRAAWWPTWVSCTALDSNLAQQEADAPLKEDAR